MYAFFVTFPDFTYLIVAYTYVLRVLKLKIPSREFDDKRNKYIDIYLRL
jgi:hypothetical protein